MRTLYDVLEIDPMANQAAVEAAFRERRLEYQPHRLTELGDVSRQIAEQEWAWIQYAYEILRDPQARSDYDAELAARVTQPAVIDEQRPMDAAASNGQHWRALYYLSIVVALVGAAMVVWAKFNTGDRQ